MWTTSDDATQGSVITALQKKPANAGNMTAAQIADLDTYAGKQDIFEIHQGLVAPNIQSGTPIMRHWVKIPRGKQRFGLGEQLVFNILGQSEGATSCGFFIYKEQY